MPPWRGSLKRGFYSGSTCLCRFSKPPHTAKRDSYTFWRSTRLGLCMRALVRDVMPSRSLASDGLLAPASSARASSDDRTRRHRAASVIGIGDDAAVVARRDANAQTVLTTDAQVEGVHFDRRFSTPGGHRVPGAGGQPERSGGHGSRAALGAALAGAAGRYWRSTTSTALVDGVAQLAGAARDGRGRRQPHAQPGTADGRYHGGRRGPRRAGC